MSKNDTPRIIHTNLFRNSDKYQEHERDGGAMAKNRRGEER